MKKLLLALLAAGLLTVSAGATTAGTKPRFTPVFTPLPSSPLVLCGPGCGGGGDGVDCNNNYDPSQGVYRNYTGYYKETIPAVNGSISANIDMVSAHITSTGDAVVAWTGVDGSGGWIQGGLDATPSGLLRYVEWNNGTEHFSSVGSASYGTAYSVVVTRTASGTWQASVGGSTPISTSSIGTPVETQTHTESLDEVPGTSCNGLDAIFKSMSPARNTMTNDTEAPDYIENLGAATFEGVQLQYGS